MRHLYTISFYLALPFIVLRLLWRSRQDRGYRNRLSERFGFYKGPKQDSSIWLHAVSYGELVAAEPLIRQIKKFFPNIKIVITTMTLTGAIRVQKVWNGDQNVMHLYIPYDIPFAVKRFLSHINPRLAIIMETELWPNLLYILGKFKTPILLANARLSEKSQQGYKRINNFIRPFLNNFAMIGAQSSEDAQRFMELGIDSQKIIVTGNLKFDIDLPLQQIEEGIQLRKQLPHQRVLIAASTHVGEEEQILAIFDTLRQKISGLLLILVPRHPERFDEVANLALKSGFHIVRRSLNQLPSRETPIFLGDTMGELYQFYAMSDVAFVGGSLVPVGGHNLLEPAALKLPIVTGPYLFNFKAISSMLSEVGALTKGTTQAELIKTILCLLQNEFECKERGVKGYEVFEKNRGAVTNLMGWIKGFSSPMLP